MTRALVLVLALLAPGVTGAVERAVIYGRSEIGFTVTQMGVEVSGTFRRFTAHVNLDSAAPEASYAQVEVDIGSLSTGDAETDAEAAQEPWLDAAGFPKATFSSRSIRPLDHGRYEVKGTLTVKGRAWPVAAQLSLRDQRDGTSVAAGEFVLDRTAFGIGGGEWNEGDLVADKVPVRFKLTLRPPR